MKPTNLSKSTFRLASVPLLGVVCLLVTLVGKGETRAADNPKKLPPIECPLRKAGVDKSKLKPFEEVEDYIKFLQRADRAEWQKPEAVVRELGLKGTEAVVDLGAGPGYFTVHLAKAVPNGLVTAIDIEPEMVRHIHRKVITGEWPNVRAQVGKPEDPGLPADADWVFVCDVLLHVPQKLEWLKVISSEMKSGARLVLIDFREGKLPEGPPEWKKIPKQAVIDLCKQAGFRLQRDASDVLPYQNFLIFVKP